MTPNFPHANIANVPRDYTKLFCKFFVGDVNRRALDTFNIGSTQLASRVFMKHWVICTLALANSGSTNFGLILI